MALVLDSGVLIAALVGDDPAHHACKQLLESATEHLLIPDPVLVEVDFLIRKTAPVETWLSFCEQIAEGAFDAFALTPTLVLRAARLQAKYSDFPLGFVDAAVFVTCEALGEPKVATLDRRHFSVLRTSEGAALDLLPARA
ncbi:MAG: PIN domain-containing protein [Actinomycetota bacterium]|nr:PIN domain-containing protein [Actinomycetota bacterium]